MQYIPKPQTPWSVVEAAAQALVHMHCNAAQQCISHTLSLPHLPTLLCARTRQLPKAIKQQRNVCFSSRAQHSRLQDKQSQRRTKEQHLRQHLSKGGSCQPRHFQQFHCCSSFLDDPIQADPPKDPDPALANAGALPQQGQSQTPGQ